MALKYTGRADELVVEGKRYVTPELYAKRPSDYAGSFDKPIPGMTKETALHLIEHSDMHSFEEAGEDLLDKVTTAPATATATKS